MINKKILITVFLSLSLIQILSAQSWHPDITHRPRIVLLESEIESIRERLSDGVYHQLWSNDLLDRRGNLIKGIYQKAAEEREISENSEEIPRAFADPRAWIAKNAAFVYVMNKRADGINDLDNFTGDSDPYPREWYVAHALEYLASLDSMVLGPDELEEWSDKGRFIDNWQWRAKELINYCQAYDLLAGAEITIPDSVTELLSHFAQNLYQKFVAQQIGQFRLVAKNNHRLMVASALGVAAVTLNGSEYAHAWIQMAMGVIHYVLFEDGAGIFQGPRQVDSDGGYAEGPFYFKYSWKHLIPFFIAMRNFNEDWSEEYTYLGIIRNLQSPWFDSEYQRIYDWITKIRMPDGRIPALEDSYQDQYLPDLAVFGGYYVWPYHSFDSNLSDEAVLNWQLADPFDLRIEYIIAGNAAEMNVPEDWERVQVLNEAGSAVFRSDWEGDAVYLHLYGQNGSARTAGSTHDHADVTSIILEYNGQVLLLDGGYISWNQHYRVNKPENHNLILVNGFGPKPPSGPVIVWPEVGLPTIYISPSPTDGFLTTQYIAEDFAYVVVEAEYGRSYQMIDSLDRQEVWEYVENDTTAVIMNRGVLYIDDQYFVICDDLDNQGTDLAKYQLLLHGNGGGTSGGSYEQTANGAIWTRGETKLLSYITALNGEVNLSDSLFIHGDGYKTVKTHTCLRATTEAVDTKYLSILYPQEGVSLPEIYNLSSPDYTGLLVDRTTTESEDRYDLIIIQAAMDSIEIPEHSFGSFSFRSIHTDAELLVLSFDAQEPENPDLMEIFGKEISFLTYDSGRVIFEPDSNITSDFSYRLSSITDKAQRIPAHYSLKQNYPNPFNPRTVINYELPITNYVELSIYNLLGQKVAMLVSESQPAGLYEAEWNASGFASGVYYYRIDTSGGFVQTRKLILLK